MYAKISKMIRFQALLMIRNIPLKFTQVHKKYSFSKKSNKIKFILYSLLKV